MERLQKVMAQAGIASRRKSEEYIKAGRVKVNGEVITELGFKVKQSDFVEVDNKPLHKEEKVYYVFYKPAQVVTTMNDEKGRVCVKDYFTDIKERVYPVGRLDYDTTGVLFMTNDGEFANLMMHPTSHLPKIYEASLSGILTDKMRRELQRGIYLEGVKTLPCEIKVVGIDEEHQTTMIMIRLIEGKNRQVKKMFEAVGLRVKRLHRLSIGDITLAGMTPGTYRRLKVKEVRVLRNQALQNRQKDK